MKPKPHFSSPFQEGNILEVFSSIQGEGLFVGERHLFVRFTGCNLRCSYCDTHKALQESDSCRIFLPGKEKEALTLPNPPSPEELLSHIMCIDSPAIHRLVSLTGGEPLLHGNYLGQLLPLIQKKKKRILLETNGTLPSQLAAIIEWVDWISMDWKLPSSTGEEEHSQEHKAFLKIALEKEVYLKVVVTKRMKQEELEALLACAPGRKIPLVLQPVTPVSNDTAPPSGQALLDAQTLLSSRFHPVLVIPQIHPLLNIP